ncbi:MAG: hypothetical protein ABGY71_09425 [bacterium]|jgi:hypothetical protein|nr:hypothetical protein [Planctomycetota bacterium]HIL53083.1 hypothetical protein [Planctomycetota bacterium]
MKYTLLSALMGISCLASVAGAQAYDVICSESFDYAAGSLDNQTGGTGWFNEWWANGPNHGLPNASSIDVQLPGHDGVGGMASDVLENTGAFRLPASGPWPNLTENFQFGRDGADIWISFIARRSVGSDDGYGGLSLQVQFGGEKLYLGSPFGTGEWGYADPVSGASATVAGSSIDTLTHLVYRIQFLPGPEQLDMWVNPVLDHPSSPPHLSAVVSDFRWNEVRLQSGVFTTGHGYEFDAIVFDTPRLEPGTAYCLGDGLGTACPCANNNDGSNGDAGCANGVNPGGAALTGSGDAIVSADTVVLTATGVQPNQPGLFFRADNAVNLGAGNPFGDGLRCAGGSLVRLGIVVADTAGVATSTAGVGAGLLGGDIRRYQYWYRNPAGSPCGASFNLSNGYEIAWQM